MSRRLLFRLVLIVVVLIALWVVRRSGGDAAPGSVPEASRPAAGTSSEGAARLAAAFRNHESDVWVESDGVVERILSDDEEGSRHQRFILRLDSGITVLVSHNIDLAPRLSGLDVGDRVSFRGEYEWNDRGGVVHWTHHDPAGRREGGWLELDGRRVR